MSSMKKRCVHWTKGADSMDVTEKVFLRDVIGEHMTALGRADERVVMVNADLMGTCRCRGFAEAFPERSFNVGIAEQDMVSFAAGLAHEGFVPYVFSMVPFITMRACEQCRTDVAYAGLPVRFIAPYAGLSGGISGATHWGMEDCAIMGAMPGMTVLEPCDPRQAEQMLDVSRSCEGPVYLRCSVEPVVRVYGEDYQFRIGKADTVREGQDGAFLCAGITVKYALMAAEAVAEQTGKQIRVVDMHTFKPLDREAVLRAAETGHVIAAQDHVRIGGLGYAAAAVLAEAGVQTQFRILGVPDVFETMAHAPYLYHKFGYDDAGLTAAMLELLG